MGIYNVSNWHPRLSSFFIGERNKQFFFRSNTVALKQSLLFLSTLQKQNKTIVFITTNTQFEPLVKYTAQRLNQKSLIGKWVGGQFTNQLRRPDCIVLLDSFTNSSTTDILREASSIQIPVISLLDCTNNNQHNLSSGQNTNKKSIMKAKISNIHYPIPGVQSFGFVYFFLDLVLKTLSVFTHSKHTVQKSISYS